MDADGDLISSCIVMYGKPIFIADIPLSADEINQMQAEEFQMIADIPLKQETPTLVYINSKPYSQQVCSLLLLHTPMPTYPLARTKNSVMSSHSGYPFRAVNNAYGI